MNDHRAPTRRLRHNDIGAPEANHLVESSEERGCSREHSAIASRLVVNITLNAFISDSELIESFPAARKIARPDRRKQSSIGTEYFSQTGEQIVRARLDT